MLKEEERSGKHIIHDRYVIIQKVITVQTMKRKVGVVPGLTSIV